MYIRLNKVIVIVNPEAISFFFKKNKKKQKHWLKPCFWHKQNKISAKYWRGGGKTISPPSWKDE